VGTTDVRLKKLTDKSRGVVKFKNIISLMVSFEGDRPSKRLNELSGGQKTVVAICVLMALQKC
jgi:chromosome segregation ATPase